MKAPTPPRLSASAKFKYIACLPSAVSDIIKTVTECNIHASEVIKTSQNVEHNCKFKI